MTTTGPAAGQEKLMHTFETPTPVRLVVRTGPGHVTITAEDTQRTTVELTALNAAGEQAIAETVVEHRDGTVLVDVPREKVGLFRPGPSVGITVTCPRGSELDAASGSADLRAGGEYAGAALRTGSGNISVETVTGPGTVKTGSGEIQIDRSTGRTMVAVGSGNVRVGEVAGELVTKTGSGDVEVDRLDGSLVTKSGSGRLVVRRAHAGKVNANGASGGVSVGIAEGTAAWLDVSTVSGRVDQELGATDPPDEGRPTVEITAHTVSGDLRIHRS
jgi:hypothetical protein